MDTGKLLVQGGLYAGIWQKIYELNVGDDMFTKLLMHFNGPDSATAIVDSGLNGYALTINGSATMSSLQSKVNRASMSFNGSTDYLTAPDSSDWFLGASDFTIDGWVMYTTVNRSIIIGQQVDGNNTWIMWSEGLPISTFGFYCITASVINILITCPWVPVTNTWYHLAVVRNGNNWYLFINGVSQPITLGGGSYSATITDFATPLLVGGRPAGSYFHTGYIDELRLSKGIARWTANFTPQTTPYTADSQTVLLIHGEPHDTSAYLNIPTFVSGAKISKSPVYRFGNGSLLLNGSTDYITFPDSADWDIGTNWTLDLWIRMTTVASCTIVAQGDNASDAWALVYDNSIPGLDFVVWQTGGRIVDIAESTNTITANIWYHVAVVKSGNNYAIYRDGVLSASGTDASAIPTISDLLRIGKFGNWGYFAGYMDEIRISNSARWTANFTPQSTAYTNDSNTKLLLHFDGDYTDYSGSAHGNATLAGSAQETSLWKFGGGSWKFLSASSQYMTVPGSEDWDFGTGNFTIDMWVKFLTLPSNDSMLFVQRFDGSAAICFVASLIDSSGTKSWSFRAENSGGSTIVNLSYTTTVVANQWYHYAVTRSGNNWYLFINGTQGATQNVSHTILSGGQILTFGSNYLHNQQFLNGYLDEIRISKGIARWTSGFTPPTAAYTADSNTQLLLHGDLRGYDSSLQSDHDLTAVSTANVWTSKFSYAGRFDGSSSYITFPNSADWQFGSGDFTVDCWVNFISLPTAGNIFFMVVQQDGSTRSWRTGIENTAGTYYMYFNYSTDGGAGTEVTSSAITIPLNTWHHLAWVRNGNTLTYYFNGVASGTTNLTGVTLYASSANLMIARSQVVISFPGYMDEVRVSNSARWTTTFTPPTSAYTSDANTKLLLHLNNNVNDSSLTTEHTVTPTNGPLIWTGKFSYAGKFNGSNSVISVPDSDDWQLGGGTGNFTIDLWVNFTTLQNSLFVGQVITGANYWRVYYNNTDNRLWFDSAVGSVQQISGYISWSPVVNTWYHIAVIRKGTSAGDWLIAVNGTATAITKTDGNYSDSIGSFARQLDIGYQLSTTTIPFAGYMDEIRISNTARWTGSFTPSATPYTTDSNTVLLLHMDNNVLDSSSTTVPKSPTNNNVTFMIEKFGGAGLFDGSVAYVATPDSDDWNFGTGDFTVDFWMRPTSLAATYGIFGTYTSSTNLMLCFGTTTGEIGFYGKNGATYFPDAAVTALSTSGAAIAVNNWYHVAIVRNGPTWKIYVNGIALGTKTDTTAVPNGTGTFNVGLATNETPTNFYFPGFIDEFRVSKGIARWTANFTPPSSAYSPDSYTKLLLHFADFTDSSNNGHTATNNNVTFMLQQFGTGALQLNGSSDYLTSPDSDDWFFSNGDFTVDFWVRFNALQTSSFLHQFNGSYQQQTMYYNDGSKILGFDSVNAGNTRLVGFSCPFSPVVGTWYHIAYVRNSSTWYIFVNGISQTLTLIGGAYTASLENISSLLYIGYYAQGSSSYMNGWIDELRISKGLARWTANFTPSTTAYTTDPSTVLLAHFDDLTDSSQLGHTVTAVNGASITANGVFSESSLLLNGSTDYVTLPDSNSWSLGSNNWTLDCWIRPAVIGSNMKIMCQFDDGTHFLVFNLQDTGQLSFNAYDGSVKGNYVTTVPAVTQSNIWYHVAFVRSGNTPFIFVNGRSIALSVADGPFSGSFPNLTTAMVIGANATSAQQYFNGQISEIRFSKGVARWTQSFTPPTAPYTDDTGKALTSVAITGLNGDTDVQYMLLSRQVAGAADGLSLRFNNDSGSNYGYQLLYGISTSPGAGRASYTNVQLWVSAPAAVDQNSLAKAIIQAKSGYIRTVLVESCDAVNGATISAVGLGGWVWNNTTDNITSILVYSATAQAIGPGTSLELYARRG